jgi:hypothetical protein
MGGMRSTRGWRITFALLVLIGAARAADADGHQAVRLQLRGAFPGMQVVELRLVLDGNKVRGGSVDRSPPGVEITHADASGLTLEGDRLQGDVRLSACSEETAGADGGQHECSYAITTWIVDDVAAGTCRVRIGDQESRGSAAAWLKVAAPSPGEEPPALEELLVAAYRRDPDARLAWFVRWAEYCRCPRPEIIAILSAALSAEPTDGWLQAQAANGLGQMGPAASAGVPALTHALAHGHGHVRRYSARALSMIGEAALPALGEIRRLAEEDKVRRVREWAAGAAKRLDQQFAL